MAALTDEVSHAGRPAQVQQEQRDCNAVEEVPKDEPVSAFKISVRSGGFIGGNLREIDFGGGEVRRGLGFGRNLDH